MCRLGWILALIGLISGTMLVLDALSMTGDAPMVSSPGIAATAVFTTIWGNTRVWAATSEMTAGADRAAIVAGSGDTGPVRAWWPLYSGLLMLVVAFGMRGLLGRR